MDSPGVRLQVYIAILLENPDGPLSRRAVCGVSLRRYPESIDIEVPCEQQPGRPPQSTKERKATAPPLHACMNSDLRVLQENKLTWNARGTLS